MHSIIVITSNQAACRSMHARGEARVSCTARARTAHRRAACERRGLCDPCSPHGPLFKKRVFEILKEAPFEQRPGSTIRLHGPNCDMIAEIFLN